MKNHYKKTLVLLFSSNNLLANDVILLTYQMYCSDNRSKYVIAHLVKKTTLERHEFIVFNHIEHQINWNYLWAIKKCKLSSTVGCIIPNYHCDNTFDVILCKLSKGTNRNKRIEEVADILLENMQNNR